MQLGGGFITDRTDVSIETCKRARNHVTKLLHENMQKLESTLIRNSEKNPKHFGGMLVIFQEISHHCPVFLERHHSYRKGHL